MGTLRIAPPQPYRPGVDEDRALELGEAAVRDMANDATPPEQARAESPLDCNALVEDAPVPVFPRADSRRAAQAA